MHKSQLQDAWRPGLGLAEVLRLAVHALASGGEGDDTRTIPAAQLEVAVLDRTRRRRAVRRPTGPVLVGLLADNDAATTTDGTAEGAPDDTTGTGPTDEG